MKTFSRLFRTPNSFEARHAAELALLRRSRFFDEAWYRETYPDLTHSRIDLVRHYLEYGAPEGRNPGPDFDTRFYLDENRSAIGAETNPLVHYIRHGAAEGRHPLPPAGVFGNRTTEEFRMEGRDDVRTLFDREFYRHSNPDVATAGIDLVRHYLNAGWREGRDPTPWFSTNHYLGANPDVVGARLNPFWHYIKVGEAEGRHAKPPIDAQIRLIEDLTPPVRPISADSEEELADFEAVRAQIEHATARAAGVVISFSHTDYLKTAAGTELFISQEQQAFASRGWAYLHFSPAAPSHFFDTGSVSRDRYRLIVDNHFVGLCPAQDILRLLRRSELPAEKKKIFVVHSILGQSADMMLSVIGAFAPAQSYFWVHDYSGICSGYNLLRNNIEYCAAPPADSAGCGICVYRESRVANASNLRKLFEAADFTVVTPSSSAKAVWMAGSGLPVRGIAVVEHCKLVFSRPTSEAGESRSEEHDGMSKRPLVEKGAVDMPAPSARRLRVAFAGQRAVHKGWPLFEALVNILRDDDAYEFFYFGKPGSVAPSRQMRIVDVTVSADARDAMTHALAVNEIDVAFLASPWPETFSFVTFEALAAGCQIVTLANSGNIAATVEKLGRGVVFEDGREAIEYFKEHRALALRRASAPDAPDQKLVYCGTTASIVFPDMGWMS